MKRLIVAIAALAMLLAACSGDGGTGVASLDTGTTPQAETPAADADDVTEEEALLAFSACMRDNGVEDFEDPIVNPDGSVTFGFVEGATDGGPFQDTDREVLEAAFESCQGELEGIALGAGDGGFDLTEIQDTLVEFAQCMRDNGVDVEDPDLSDFAPGGGGDGFAGPFGDLDITDPDVQAAVEACQGLFAGFGTFGGDS